jgi:hypothetical protein
MEGLPRMLWKIVECIAIATSIVLFFAALLLTFNDQLAEATNALLWSMFTLYVTRIDNA